MESTKLQVYAEKRRDLRPALLRMCEQLEINPPERFGPDEPVLIDLAQHWLALRGEIATQQIDNTLLPRLLEETVDANLPREALWRERIRHVALAVSGGVSSAGIGLAIGLVVGFLETITLGIVKLPFIIVPALVVFITSLVVWTARYHPAITGDTVVEMVKTALWLASLTALASSVVFAAWRARERRYSDEDKNDGLDSIS
jgi:hypothetical protein